MRLTGLPEPDDLEITVLGGGTGESVVVHLGDGQWLVVDSFVDGDVPAPLRYLRSVDADLDRVRMVVATHWHDDHIDGTGDLLRACPNATLGCPAAFLDREVIAFVLGRENDTVTKVRGSRNRKIKDAFSAAEERPNHVEKFSFLRASSPLFPRDPPPATVTALSPGAEDIAAAHEALANVRRDDRNRIVRVTPNDMSVALIVSLGNAHAVLAADLESHPDERRGWKAVLNYAVEPSAPPDLLKVPHHGSPDAHEPRMWEQWLAPNPTSVVTGWQGPVYHLPTTNDLERLLNLSSSVWVAGHPPGLVEALALGGQIISVSRSNLGRVTARRGAGDDGWLLDCEGGAGEFRPETT